MKPIFIVGSGRSGTTVIYDRLTSVTNAATVPALGGRYPFLLSAALAANRLGIRSWIFRPSSEALTLLAHCGLSADRSHTIARAFSADDISDQEKASLRKYLNKMAVMTGRELVVIKNTGNSMRVAAIDSAVPQCNFVYVIRDPRAVVSSLLKVGFWPRMPLWWCGKTPEQRQSEGEPPEVTAARHWLHQVEAAETGFETLSNSRVHRVHYEQFVTDPFGSLRQLTESLNCKADLESDTVQGVEAARTERWKSALTSEQVVNIEAVVQDRMTRYGYEHGS